MNSPELKVISLQNGESEEVFDCLVSKDEFYRIQGGDYELANKVLQQAIEKKNRLLAFKFLKEQSTSDLTKCPTEPVPGTSGLVHQRKRQTEMELGESSPIDEVSNTSASDMAPMADDALNDSLSASDNAMENSSLSTRWSDNEVKLLLELYRANIPKFKERKFRPKAIYEEIAKNFSRFSDIQIETKMKNLKKTYKVILDNNKRTGRGRITWPHFNLMHEIFGEDPENEPLSIASSTLGVKVSRDLQNQNPVNIVEESDSDRDAVEISKPKKKKLKAESSEPEWFKSFREESAQRHQERMVVQKEFLNIFKEWVQREK